MLNLAPLCPLLGFSGYLEHLAGCPLTDPWSGQELEFDPFDRSVAPEPGWGIFRTDSEHVGMANLTTFLKDECQVFFHSFQCNSYGARG